MGRRGSVRSFFFWSCLSSNLRFEKQKNNNNLESTRVWVSEKKDTWKSLQFLFFPYPLPWKKSTGAWLRSAEFITWNRPCWGPRAKALVLFWRGSKLRCFFAEMIIDRYIQYNYYIWYVHIYIYIVPCYTYMCTLYICFFVYPVPRIWGNCFLLVEREFGGNRNLFLKIHLEMFLANSMWVEAPCKWNNSRALTKFCVFFGVGKGGEWQNKRILHVPWLPATLSVVALQTVSH